MDIKINELAPLIMDDLICGLVPYITSVPGIGKSDVVKTITEDSNLALIDVRLSQCDSSDLLGIPKLGTDRLEFAPPKMFPLEGDKIPEGKKGWLLFFDEFSSANKSVEAAAYRILLDKQVGEFNLHKKVAIVCAGNGTGQGAIANRLSTASQSRMIHYNLVTDANAWCDWAITKQVHHKIIGFIQFRPDLLHDFDPKHKDNTFPCPRTWEFLDRKLKLWGGEIDESRLPSVAGTIGSGASFEFKAFLDIFSRIPSMDILKKNPSLISEYTEPSMQYALSATIGHNTNAHNIKEMFPLIEALPLEFQVICIKQLIQSDRTIKRNPLIGKWGTLHRSILVGD